ncbi:hypothetical protein PPERSA_05321 [Pseudocohnilembus persalinus]|uniref:Transmembrane protein n=1 Tax=Pseudocohnilembus persalinus TaxID=266149 RepID=A0A0V0R632_PSEPJ|nr:hypothetical protein PPERSA_05321 [Pseudocohnilembus persalinus]|eukprot:KRX09929.1 hypothetical protein PPERSA_05321 [Pseudocohnilembus persalinus]
MLKFCALLVLLIANTYCLTTIDYSSCTNNYQFPGGCELSTNQIQCSEWENIWSSQQGDWTWDDEAKDYFQQCMSGYIETNSGDCLQYYKDIRECGTDGGSSGNSVDGTILKATLSFIFALILLFM